MKIKLIEVVNSVEQLNELVKVKMPFKASYAISRTIKKLAPELELYNEKRTELLKELGVPNEDGQSYKFKTPEDALKFQEEIKKVLESEIEVDIHKLKAEDLGDTVVEPKLIVDFIFE